MNMRLQEPVLHQPYCGMPPGNAMLPASRAILAHDPGEQNAQERCQKAKQQSMQAHQQLHYDTTAMDEQEEAVYSFISGA